MGPTILFKILKLDIELLQIAWHLAQLRDFQKVEALRQAGSRSTSRFLYMPRLRQVDIKMQHTLEKMKHKYSKVFGLGYTSGGFVMVMSHFARCRPAVHASMLQLVMRHHNCLIPVWVRVSCWHCVYTQERRKGISNDPVT